MMAEQVERYVALRQALGFTLRDAHRLLRHFARFVDERAETHLRATTALEWAAQAPSPNARHIRLGIVVRFARFLHAEDARHEVPARTPFPHVLRRIKPYIYTDDEIVALIAATGQIRQSYALRRQTYATLIGLIASTGLRISEALDLRVDDVLTGGVLRIEDSKFGKSRLVPLHPTAAAALRQYLDQRLGLVTSYDHLFLAARTARISSSMANYTFRRLLRLSGVGAGCARSPRIHDLRHTFATRALQRCGTSREAVGKHFVALSTYLGHVDIASTYWYLEASADLMADIAAAAEALVAGEGR
jgi:integrase/recombinase XerD